MKRAILTLIALVVAAVTAHAQTRLSIVDALPPYLLSARLLDNGHFSITTRYTGEPKTLIYQEDGSGGPLNYTSHVHFKVDDMLFQLPFELNPATREAPPENPLTITQLFRDTVAGIARVNARMFGVMPDGDTILFLFTMHPVLRESGGFIRMQAEVANTTSRPRSVGVLMLVDTKIGDNDRAPIISSFGYRARETEYRRGVALGVPEFWLGLEGTPTDPGLTARGNLRASDLIEPDYVLMGNWKDNTAVPGAFGLASALWNERQAFDVEYTDSAVLLLWHEQTMAPGERRLRAATELGIVDSLDVSSTPGIDEIWLAGAGLASSCLGFDVVRERPCGVPGYSPYAPDSLQALYLVTNLGTRDIDRVRVVVPSVPAGLDIAVRSSAVVPSTVKTDSTGVSTLTIRAIPRLETTTYAVPLAVVARDADTLHRDTICVVVPGLLGELTVDPVQVRPLCPGLSDTIDVRVRLDGPRCLALGRDAELIGASPDIDHFEILTPLPDTIPADGYVTIRVKYTAGAVGMRHSVRIAVHALDRGLNARDVDTTVVISDTATIEGESREASFRFAEPTDTLDLGAVCVGDTTLGDWTISNVGGCALVIGRDYSFENDALSQFGVANDAGFPMSIGRDGDSLVTVRFAPKVAGEAIARFIIRSDAWPFVDTLVVRGRGDVPILALDTVARPIDTLCPGERFQYPITVSNPTACDVTITSITSSDKRFAVDPGPVTLAPHSQRRLFVVTAIAPIGRHATQIRITGSDGAEHVVDVAYVVADRSLSHDAVVAIGDARPGATSVTKRLVIVSDGAAPARITGLRVDGANRSEFTVALPNGETLPIELAPGTTLEVDVTLAPDDLGDRRARLVVETGARGVCDPDAPIELEGRGVLPLLDAPKRRVSLGRRCAGEVIDTVIELRNLGNAPVTVSSVATVDSIGHAEVIATGLPFVIPADSTRHLRVRIAPEQLGDFAVALRLEHDGAWFTAPDTLLQVVGSSVLCATIAADTVRGRVGDRVRVPVRITAPGLSGADIARLLNDIGATGVELTLGHDPGVARFDAAAPTGGMLGGLAAATTITTTASTVRATSPDNAGALDDGPIVAMLEAEILLGTTDRTVLALDVGRIAMGHANITTHDGLIIADYCAIDRRYVAVSGVVVAATSTPLPPDGLLVVRTPTATDARVTLHDASGRAVVVLHDGPLDGTRTFALDGVDSGVYTAVVVTPNASASARVVVVR